MMDEQTAREISYEVVDGALTKAAEKMDDITGSCPLDMCDWERPEGCVNICWDLPNASSCWRLYFVSQIQLDNQ